MENNFQKTPNTVFGLECLPGLLEVEPLGFNCLYGSEHIKIECCDFYDLNPISQFILPNSRSYKSAKGDLMKKIKNEPESDNVKVNLSIFLYHII